MNSVIKMIVSAGLIILAMTGLIVAVAFLLRSTIDSTPSVSPTNPVATNSISQTQTLSIGQYFWNSGSGGSSLMFAGLINPGVTPTIIINHLIAGVGYDAGVYSTFAFYVPIHADRTAIFTLEGHTWKVSDYDLTSDTITIQEVS